jgi:hypothetical protein
MARTIYPPAMARAGQRRIQGALFAFLTIFFAGVTAAAYDATSSNAGVWVIVVAGAALTIWMGGLAIRTFRLAREEMTR